MFCRFCGGQIPDEAVFCPDCGKQLCTDTKPKQTARQRQSISESFRTGYQKGKQIGESVVGGQNQAKKSAVRGTAAVTAGGTAAKAGTGGGAKLVFGVLAAAVVVGGGTAVLHGLDDGGGGYDPPVSIEQDNDGGGYSGTDTGGYSVSYDAQQPGDYEYFVVQMYDPNEDQGANLVYIDWNGGNPSLCWVNRDGSFENGLPMSYDPSSGKLTLTFMDSGGAAQMVLQKSTDGSWSGTLYGETDEGSGSTYVKLTGALPADGENWTIPDTGETLSYYDLCYHTESTELGKRFRHEGEAHGAEIYEYYGADDTTPYTPQTPTYTPSSGGTVDPPQDVLDYYVKTEAQKRLREQATGQAQSHVTLPSNWNITQEQFDALVQDAMHGEILGQ